MKNTLISALFLLTFLCPCRAAEPLYAGKPLTFWLDGLNSNDPLIREESILVLTDAGPAARSAIPPLEAQIRSPQVTRAETQVSSDGQNLVSVLHSLYTSSRDFKNEINTAMKAAFGDDFEELVFPPAADQRIQLRIRWKSLRREQSASDLSDGTLRFLFLLAVLANPSPPPLLAIDEPETGLHSFMLPIVAEYAQDASNRSQVILTTHSPDLLDAFGDIQPTTTIVERHDGETKLRVIVGDDLRYWLKQYTLGELFRSKELEAMR
ncbi:MAG: AAA family ATPase [Gemmataceae bacterium]